MITLHEAIFAINDKIKVIRGDEAFDIDGNPVAYDKAQAKAKLAELQAAEEVTQKDEAAAKQSALDKLTKLGLTQDEIKALIG